MPDKKEIVIALRRQNAVLNEWAAIVLADLAGISRRKDGLHYPDGTPVQFDLPPGRNMYRYHENKATKERFCYTPWKCARGWYWAFNYSPRGKGSRSGNPERLAITKPAKFRKRKQAAGRADARYHQATGLKE